MKQCLDDIKRSCCCSGKTTSETTSGAVSERVVARSSVHDFGYRFVGGKLESGKGNGHGEGGGVGDVEGTETFIAEDGAGTLRDGAVD